MLLCLSLPKGSLVAPKHKPLLPSTGGYTRKSIFQCFDGILLLGQFASRTPDLREEFAMKRKKVGAMIIESVLLSMIMILLTGCNGTNKEASALSTSSAVAEAAETTELLSVAGNTEQVEGKVYTFDKDNAYKFSSDGGGVSSIEAQTYGSFSISGIELMVESGTKNGVAAYSVPEGHVSIQYTYSDELLNATDEEWHLVDDNSTSIDVFKIDKAIPHRKSKTQPNMI